MSLTEDDLHKAARKLRDQEELVSHIKYDIEKLKPIEKRLEEELKDTQHKIEELEADYRKENNEHERLSRVHDEAERAHKDEMKKLKKAA